MRKKLCLSLFALGTALLPMPTQAQDSLTRYRDKNRLLLVFAPGQSDPRWQKQNVLLAGSDRPFHERDLLRFDYLEQGSMPGARERTEFGVKPGQFRVLLIGKDGHVASASSSPIALHQLTVQIDRMPMRREEMRRSDRSSHGD